MNKHLVIVSGVMYPNPTATGLCAQRLASLLEDICTIDIICVSSAMKTETVDYSNNIRIHALSGGTLRAEANNKGALKILNHFHGQLQIKTNILGNMKWYAYAALSKLEEINRKNKIDVVFSVCSPMSAHYAAKKYHERHADIRWVAYTVDLFAIPERIRPLFCTLKKLATFEKRLLQSADAVLLSEEIFINHSDITETLNDVAILPYVLPEQKKSWEKTEEKQGIDCVFAGSFYQDLRNPEVMFDAFSRLQRTKTRLHLYGSGCEEIVTKYASKCSSIIVHGRVSHEEILYAYENADVLVNIGNANSDFIPSKVFEYVATGKPIVNFYYGRTPDRVLERYPIAYNISNVAKLGDVQNLEHFLEESCGKKLNRSEIEFLFPQNTGAFVRKQLINVMKLERDEKRATTTSR